MSSVPHIAGIGQDLTITTFGYLNTRELCRLGATCTALHQIAGEFFRQLGDELEQVEDSVSAGYNLVFASEGRTPTEVLGRLKTEYLTKIATARQIFSIETGNRIDRHHKELIHLIDNAQNDQMRMRLACFLHRELPTFDTQAARLDNFTAFIAREKVTQRFLLASRTIPKLYASQKEAADVLLLTRIQFQNLELNPSSESFCAAETFILERVGRLRDASLTLFAEHRVWNVPTEARAETIRDWLRSPPTEHDRNSLLAVTTWEEAASFSHLLPDEIRYLKNLKKLELKGYQDTGGVTTLPETLAQLSLNALVLEHNSLLRLPPVLARMPYIEYLEIRENQRPITVLSDEIARAQCTGFAIHNFRFLRSSVPHGRAEEEYGQFRDYVGLDPHHLTEVPFFIWFRDTFSISYLPFHHLVDPLINSTNHLLRVDFLRYLPWYNVLGVVLFMSVVVSVVACMFLINSPILLANMLINGIIEPLVTLSRDLLGYSRMVRL
ncbi:MAG: hypothetical protein HYX48_03655 [Chlamydiales bacterium]|nr:hypothetical protein [Chlamydiales bacterium]